ncbi:MAG: SPFH domain-containing protein [Lachnospiraceae bacterium]|nr:hypothetical protein [Lachnospiraceae bacterium]MBQ8260717.1 SPFH domain-containing protein [Lachnospiraceae bacterium]
MGLFSKELSNVVEWNESQPGVLFWKWTNQEIKKGSVLIVRPGQDAIFLYNGRVEGIFQDEGKYDIESQIIPFLSTLKGFKFGFNSGLRAEVLFINTKEILCKWGTKNPINLQAPGLPGGMPIRAFGTFSCKIAEHDVVIDKLAGIKQIYSVEDVKERIMGSLDMLVMQWIGKEGRDMFNLQMDAMNIAKGIQSDLDMEMRKIGIAITDFKIESFSYPEQVKKMQEKAAAQAMVGDVNKYSQIAMADSLDKPGGSRTASDMMGMQMGMMMGQQMINQMQMNQMQGGMMNQAAPQMAPQAAPQAAPAGNEGGAVPKFCPNCGTPTGGMKFCGNCGNKLA